MNPTRSNGNASARHTAARLLVIDDDDTFRDALSELLRDDGFEVDTADHATAAVHQLESKRFDVVLSDLVMPGNGHLVVEYVRSHQPDTPVIVISSQDSPQQTLATNGWRSVPCLIKPVHFAQVLQALRRAIQKRDRAA
jgi:DNA-binding NtrC family response regulator